MKGCGEGDRGIAGTVSSWRIAIIEMKQCG